MGGCCTLPGSGWFVQASEIACSRSRITAAVWGTPRVAQRGFSFHVLGAQLQTYNTPNAVETGESPACHSSG